MKEDIQSVLDLVIEFLLNTQLFMVVWNSSNSGAKFIL
jgi:hypothetical protein